VESSEGIVFILFGILLSFFWKSNTDASLKQPVFKTNANGLWNNGRYYFCFSIFEMGKDFLYYISCLLLECFLFHFL